MTGTRSPKVRIDYYHQPGAPVANTLVTAVSAVVRDPRDNVLLMRYLDDDLYILPGGTMVPGSTVAQAVTREVRRETAVDVVVQRLVGVYSDPGHVVDRGGGEIRQEFSLCFAGTATGGTPATANPRKQAVWLPIAGLAHVAMHPSIRLRLEHALAATATAHFT